MIHKDTLGAEGSRRRAVKIVVILLFVAILASLGSALFFLVTDAASQAHREGARATRRIVADAVPVAHGGYYFGLIPGKIN